MTTASIEAHECVVSHKIGVLRLGIAGAFTAAALLVLWWIGTFIPFSSPTHAYIGLFTTAPVGSAAALVSGLCWPVVFGALAGKIVHTYRPQPGPLTIGALSGQRAAAQLVASKG
jgi:hypothetical protein